MFIPLAVTWMLLTLYIHANPVNFSPVWSDELIYWREVDTFKNVGFNGGYFTFDEMPAPANFTHFGAHGPWIAVFMGLVSRIMGWNSFIMPLFNLGILTLTLAVWVFIVKPDLRQSLVTLFILLTYWPLFIYILTGMMESLNQAIAILLAAGFYRQVSGHSSRRFQVILFGLIFLAALIRPLWALLFLPFFVIYALHHLRGWVIGLACCMIIFGLSIYWNAPYPPGFVAYFFRQFSQSPILAFQLFVQHLFSNLARLSQGNLLEIGLRVQIAAVIMVVFWGQWLNRLSRWLPKLSASESCFHRFNLLSVLLLTLVLYDIFDWRDYRVLAPHLLLTILLFIAYRHLKLSLLLAVANLIFVMAFLTVYKDNGRLHFYADTQSIGTLREEIKSFITYDSTTTNSWCNTVFGVDFPPDILMSLPSGIGYSVKIFNDLSVLQSRYILLNRVSVSDRADWQYQTSIGSYDLYLNLAAKCSD
jgi:hypothetical protein